MINYPVDVANTLWALYQISTTTVIYTNHRWPRADGGEIAGLDSDYVPLLEVQFIPPAYDVATEHLERATPIVDVDANTHTRGWNIVANSQEDIDAAAERALALSFYLDLKNHVGTAEERATRLENVVAYMLRDLYE